MWRCQMRRSCALESCTQPIVRRLGEARSDAATRLYCSRGCASQGREQFSRDAPSYRYGPAYDAAVRAIIRAHKVEFAVLYRNAVLADTVERTGT